MWTSGGNKEKKRKHLQKVTEKNGRNKSEDIADYDIQFVISSSYPQRDLWTSGGNKENKYTHV